jgi:hypothetical protein
MKFVFNHFIILFKEEGRGDPYLYGEIDKQIDLILPELKEKVHQIYG